MAKQTEVKAQLILRRNGAKQEINFEDILKLTGTTKLVKCDIIETKIIDIGVKHQPERAEKQRLMNKYKKIISDVTEMKYDISSRIDNMNIMIRDKNAETYVPILNLYIKNGDIEYDNGYYKIDFCLCDPDVLGRLKKFIDFVMTIISNNNYYGAILSDKIAIYRNPDHTKLIIAELFDGIIKLTTIGGTNAEVKIGLKINNLTRLFESCEKLSSPKCFDDVVVLIEQGRKT